MATRSGEALRIAYNTFTAGTEPLLTHAEIHSLPIGQWSKHVSIAQEFEDMSDEAVHAAIDDLARAILALINDLPAY